MRRASIHLAAAGLLAAALLAAGPVPTLALVLHEGGTVPSVRPHAETVGRWTSNASCVFVGPNHLITTQHQGGGIGALIDHDGDPATDPYVVAEIFAHGQADLRVARLETASGAPADLSYYIEPYTGAHETNYEAVLGGYGKGRGADLMNGDIHYGYEWAGSDNLTQRWGENAIAYTKTDSGTYVTDVIGAYFNPEGSFRVLPGEAATAEYDSGGGWFINIGTPVSPDWRVAGLSRGVTPHENPSDASWFRQPDGTWGPDAFDAVRIGSYDEWINGILHPHTWAADAGGNWFDDARWNHDGFWAGDGPHGADRWAVLGDALTAARTITLDDHATLGTLRIESSHPYTVAGAKTLTFESDDNTFATLDVNPMNVGGLDAPHRIEVPIHLADRLVLTQQSDEPLTLAGGVSGDGGITKKGAGEVVLTQAGTFLDGVTISSGTVAATHPNALGTGMVNLGWGTLKLIADTDTVFANRINVTGNGTLRVEPATPGETDRTLSVGSLSILGGNMLVTSGTAGYEVAVLGQTNLSGDVTFFTASAPLTLAGGLLFTSGTLTKSGGEDLTVEGGATFGTGTVVDVRDGTFRLNGDPGDVGDPRATVRVTADTAAAVFDADQHLEGLVLEAGEAGLLPGRSHTLTTGLLDIAEDAGDPLATLDLAAGNLVVDYEPGASPYADVEGWVEWGYNGGQWNAAADAVGVTTADGNAMDYALAVADDADPDFEGEIRDGSSVLVQYTFCGDTNLDGQLTSTDVTRLVTAFAGGLTDNTPRWVAADFNYDNALTSTDITLLVTAFSNHAGETLSGGDPTPVASDLALAETEPAPTAYDESGWTPPTTMSLVPEPATLMLVALGGLAALARRR